MVWSIPKSHLLGLLLPSSSTENLQNYKTVAKYSWVVVFSSFVLSRIRSVFALSILCLLAVVFPFMQLILYWKLFTPTNDESSLENVFSHIFSISNGCSLSLITWLTAQSYTCLLRMKFCYVQQTDSQEREYLPGVSLTELNETCFWEPNLIQLSSAKAAAMQPWSNERNAPLPSKGICDYALPPQYAVHMSHWHGCMSTEKLNRIGLWVDMIVFHG